jgi:myo-inositol-1(or 4)-monophosphatase
MYSELLDACLAAAEAGSRVVKSYFRRDSLEVRAKAEHDFVSQADREAELAVLGEIRRRYPDHGVLAEEGGSSDGVGDYQWIVDPLDGTTNFLQGLPIWGISIACRRGSETVVAAVLDPEGGNRFSARRGGGAFWNDRPMKVSERPGLEGAFLATGYPFRARATLDIYLAAFRSVFLEARAIRRCGAAALDLAYTAAGVFDGFFEFRLSPWDIAAGALLIEEAGGRVSDLDGGGRYLATGNVIAGGAEVQRELLATVRRHADEAALEQLFPG